MSTKGKVAIAIIAGLLLCVFVPANHWDRPIPSQRYISEGVLVSQEGSGSFIVRLNSIASDGTWFETGTYLLLEGSVPDYAEPGQEVRIGYSKEGLYMDTSQEVSVSFYKQGSLLTAYVLPLVSPVTLMAQDFHIADVKSDGSLLQYYVAA